MTRQFLHLDPQLGGRTVVTFTSPDIHLLQVELLSPAGRVVRPDSPFYSIDLEDRERIEISLPEAEGYQPVLGARVLATVDRPMGGSIDLELRDNGAGADVSRHDGIYSAFFTHFNGNGRYAVVARVVNDGRARVKVGGTPLGSRGPVLARLARRHAEPSSEDFPLDKFVQGPSGPPPASEVTTPAEVFQRSVCSGAFRLEDFPEQPPDDIFPPASVTDLSVTSVDGSVVSLRWTSPGDDLDTGQVSQIELRWSEDPKELLTQFNSSMLVDDGDLAAGNLQPPPAGQPHEVSVTLPGPSERPRTVYFAVIGVDDCGHRSPSFAIYPVNLGSLGSAPTGRLMWRPLAWKVGLGALLSVVLIAAALGVVYQHRRQAAYRAVATTSP
ncbi:CLCA1 [Cordylochernes scorpioides]|uniref:CLCA1 n=1 Tax=Cordylochernes scorpioides TaxID=51811 RepID=A0ABY6L5C7_9ARAC|nr:CLCA1 [Cordylochernes scorpioides]